MSNPNWTRIEELFDEVVLLSTGERAARLSEPSVPPEIREQVEQLLQSYEAAGYEFLAPRGLDSLDELDDVGSTIGPYRMIRRLGEGGFGDVYLAEQAEPLQRLVAIKVLKPGMDSRAVVARFESERSTLALLDHANIAGIHDAGTTPAGRPYFVMEFVDGQTLTRFVSERRLDLRQRLDLFLQVCEAIQHAHQRGIVHRDLKPSNILIQESDGRGRAKVIDFGIAKAIESSFESGTILTVEGQLVGTPEYMSPEQARMDGRIDTRTDIYQLGALLYELLTGERPFEFSEPEAKSLPSILRTILEREPPRPSSENPGERPSIESPCHRSRTRERPRLDYAQGGREGAGPALRIGFGVRGRHPSRASKRARSRNSAERRLPVHQVRATQPDARRKHHRAARRSRPGDRFLDLAIPRQVRGIDREDRCRPAPAGGSTQC